MITRKSSWYITEIACRLMRAYALRGNMQTGRYDTLKKGCQSITRGI